LNRRRCKRRAVVRAQV